MSCPANLAQGARQWAGSVGDDKTYRHPCEAPALCAFCGERLTRKIQRRCSCRCEPEDPTPPSSKDWQFIASAVAAEYVPVSPFAEPARQWAPECLCVTGAGHCLGPVTQRARQLLRGGVIPRTSQKCISPVRRWVRRSKLTRTTLPRGRAAFEDAEHARHTVTHWNSHTTTIFRGYGMFELATTAGFPNTRASVCFSGAAAQDGMPSPGLATPDGTSASEHTRSSLRSWTRSPPKSGRFA